MSTIQDLRKARIQKMDALKNLSIQPYPARSYRNTLAGQVIKDYESFENKEEILAGRITAIRSHGGVTFIDIKDQSGKIQLYIKEDVLLVPDRTKNEIGFSEIELLDLGDFIESDGIVTKTPRGEISIEARNIRLLTKAIRPMPSSWDGLKDKEIRLRKRYLDLNMNEDVFERFIRKSKFWQANRQFLLDHGFMEVETPVMEHATGGADATPFVTHHNYLDQDFYLRISTELYQKRLIGGGMEKIFTIGPNFRNEGLSDEHHQEYTQVEWYWAYANYRDNMELVKEMFRYIAKVVYGKTTFSSRGHTFDLDDEWKEIDYTQVLKEKYGVDIFNTNLDELKSVAGKHNVTIDKDSNEMRIIDALWKAIRKTISGPAFLVNEPAFMSPLAKSKPEDPRLTERFHIVLGGSELGNGYSELNDPIDQLDRFKKQQEAREKGDSEAQMLDLDYVEMLEYGMPPCSGYAHSDRLFWFLEDVPSREGILFPQMKSEIDANAEEIYPELFNQSENSKQSQPKQDFSKKLVIVVNSSLENWQVASSVSHVSAYIGNKLNNDFATGEYFEAKDKTQYPRNSQYPIIVVSAKPGQMINFLAKVRNSGLLYHAYIKEMLETTDDSKIEEMLRDKNESDIEYLAIGVFGDNKEVELITKNYSLLK